MRALVLEVPELAQEVRALVLEVQVLAQEVVVVARALGVPEWALGVPVEARKQSRATLPLSQVAERPLQGGEARQHLCL